MSARVETAKKLFEAKNAEPGGCSGFVSKVLGLSPPKTANDIIGSNSIEVDTKSFSNVSPGFILPTCLAAHTAV